MHTATFIDGAMNANKEKQKKKKERKKEEKKKKSYTSRWKEEDSSILREYRS